MHLARHLARIFQELRSHVHLTIGILAISAIGPSAALATWRLAQPAPAPPEAVSQWRPHVAGEPGRILPQPLPEGEPGDLAERVCAHASKICPQRDTCAGTVRLRQKDGLHSMREQDVLAAHTEADLLATGVWRCWP